MPGRAPAASAVLALAALATALSAAGASPAEPARAAAEPGAQAPPRPESGANGPSAAPAGPPDRAARLAAACNGCHGPDGRGAGAVPALADRSRSALIERLEAWRERKTAAGADHVMVRFARLLSAEDVRALAAHYGDDDSEARSDPADPDPERYGGPAP